MFAVAFVAGFYLAGFAIRLDRVVTSRFEGQLFRVPSRVFSAPTILHAGLGWGEQEFTDVLRRLGYREETSSRSLTEGRFVLGRNWIRVRLRAFEHPTRAEPPRDLVIRFADGGIDEIRDAETRRELAAVYLEPEQVGAYYGPNREQRDLVSVDDVPKHLVEAVLAVEDQRFHSHHGVDLQRIAGAFLANLQAGSIRQGGSTLTQQLVKNFFLTPERTVERKLQEAIMSLLVEARYDKQQILESYLNEIYLGQRGSTAIHGVGEAARLYFGKKAENLSLGESALLVAIIKSPNGMSPYRDAERAMTRRNLVLDLMLDQGRIDDAELAQARREPLRLAEIVPDSGAARYFLDAVRRQLPEVYDAKTLTSEGLRIYSTLDLRMQRVASRVLREGLEGLEERYAWLRQEDPKRRVQGCLIALRPQTGEVLALVGGRDYRASQFDRCTQARRQAGSVFKPIVYVAALEPASGGPAITLASSLDDAPLRLPTPSGDWEPANYDGEFHGTVSVREALERSLNVATARLANEVGIGHVADVARRLGIESRLPPVPSLALGTADVSPMEIARVYATLANGGVRPEIRTFDDMVDSSGNPVERRQIGFERVLDSGTAYLATSLLAGVVERGTGARIRGLGVRGPVAGKTGTSDDERDAWFVGFTPELVVVVWVGFDAPRSMKLAGGQAALPIWARFTREVTGGRVRGAFRTPPDVVEIDIEPTTGALALPGCPQRRTELFLIGTEPEHVCPEGGRRGSRGTPGVRRFLDWMVDSLFGDEI